MKRWVKSQTALITIMLLLSLVMAGGLTFFSSIKAKTEGNNDPYALTYFSLLFN